MTKYLILSQILSTALVLPYYLCPSKEQNICPKRVSQENKRAGVWENNAAVVILFSVDAEMSIMYGVDICPKWVAGINGLVCSLICTYPPSE